MFQNMVSIDNILDQPSQKKLDILKNIMINEGISIIGPVEINNNWSKIPIKRIYIIGQVDGLKQGGVAQDITKLLLMMDHFKVEAQPSWR